MKEKIKRILDLIRTEKLTLEDASPLLAALHTKLALQATDRELIDSLLKREDIDTTQIAEHLMLLRGLKETPPAPAQPPRPQPPRPPGFPFESGWEHHNWERDVREQARTAREQARHATRGRTGGIEGMVERITDTVERAVETAMEGVERTMTGTPSYSYSYDKKTPSTRILRIEAQSEDGDSYDANLPMTLAPHLHKLIPEHGRRALEKAGMSIEALQLIIEAEPPAGKMIDAQDENGNSVSISIK